MTFISTVCQAASAAGDKGSGGPCRLKYSCNITNWSAVIELKRERIRSKGLSFHNSKYVFIRGYGAGWYWRRGWMGARHCQIYTMEIMRAALGPIYQTDNGCLFNISLSQFSRCWSFDSTFTILKYTDSDYRCKHRPLVLNNSSVKTALLNYQVS